MSDDAKEKAKENAEALLEELKLAEMQLHLHKSMAYQITISREPDMLEALLTA